MTSDLKAECQHDWRVDPRMLLSSIPPQQRIVCIECGASQTRVDPAYRDLSDPKTWRKA